MSNLSAAARLALAAALELQDGNGAHEALPAEGQAGQAGAGQAGQAGQGSSGNFVIEDILETSHERQMQAASLQSDRGRQRRKAKRSLSYR